MCAPDREGLPDWPGFRDVFDAYLACRRGKRSKPGAIRFEMRALDETHALASRLAAGRYGPSRSACFVSSGAKPREVYAASFRDRVVNHLLVRELEPVFERLFIHDSYACRPGKGTHAAVDRLGRLLRAATLNGKRRAFYLKLDVRAFFVSIDREVLWHIVEDRTRGRGGPAMPRVLEVLRTVLFHDPTADRILACPAADLEKVPEGRRLGCHGPGIGLPIGNLTSQFLANVFLNELDLFVKHELRARWYVRYVDDMVLVHEDPCVLRAWQARIDAFLRTRLHLELNPDATRLGVVSRGVDFLGYVVRPHYLLSRRRVVGNLWTRLHGLHRRLVRKDGTLAVYDVAAARASGLVAVLNSYLGHFRRARCRRTVIRMARAFPWLARFAVLRPAGRGWVAADRWAPTRDFPDLWFQWSFFRRIATAADPDSLLFFQVGRYFEVYEEQTDLAARALGLRPIPPRPGFKRRCGFKRGHLAAYLRRAVGHGLTVVVVEETGRPLSRIKERLVTRVARRNGDGSTTGRNGDVPGGARDERHAGGRGEAVPGPG